MLVWLFSALVVPIGFGILFYFRDRYKYPELFNRGIGTSKRHLINTVILSFIMSFTLYLTHSMFKVFHGVPPQFIVAKIIVYFLTCSIFFFMLYRRSLDGYRAFLFVLVAIFFTISFVINLYELRGHFLIYTYEDIIHNDIPFCHIGIPQTIIPMALKGTIIFPGQGVADENLNETIGSMFILWIAVSLTLGRGWCSWSCIFGGWEEGFSRLKRKALIKKCNPTLRWLPFAMLIVVVLVSIITAAPFYCWWLCPFKGVSECGEVVSSINIVQTVVFVVIFVTLVIVLPILTRKRTQCAFFCPFGAFQSFVDKISPFDVRIDRSKCIDCKKCMNVCPVLALNDESLAKGKSGFPCVKCGKCMDVCPENAISFHLKGTPVGNITTRFSGIIHNVFVFFAFLIIANVSGEMVATGLYRIFLLITTGSVLQ